MTPRTPTGTRHVRVDVGTGDDHRVACVVHIDDPGHLEPDHGRAGDGGGVRTAGVKRDTVRVNMMDRRFEP